MALLSLGGVCLLLRYLAAASGDDVPVIFLTENESSQVLLDCSLGSEGIRVKKFDWKVNGTQEVFLYDDGDVYTEDPQFKGRVQHESLDSNNASITISNALVKDTGIYECIYIDETNQKTTKSRISLTVGACPKPVIRVKKSNLKCEIEGAFPEPSMEWQDSARKPIKDAVVTKFEWKQDERFHKILEINVTQSGIYYCVVTQKQICHQIEEETDVHIPAPEPSTDPESSSVVTIVFGVLSVVFFLGFIGSVSFIVYKYRKERKTSKSLHAGESGRLTTL